MPEHGREEASRTTPTVLIVDDSTVVRGRLASMLEEVPGVTVVGGVGDVKAATAALRRLHPDVMVLDLHLPDGNGIDLLRHLARWARRPRVIVLTNLPDAQYRDACMEAGAELFLDKSTEFEKIATVVGPTHGRKGW
jgi:DNA-binding NarL/FixJ family response regulator